MGGADMPRRPTAADGTGGMESGSGGGGWHRRMEPEAGTANDTGAWRNRSTATKEVLPPLYGSTGSRAADARR